eukprot:s1176_g4.t1
MSQATESLAFASRERQLALRAVFHAWGSWSTHRPQSSSFWGPNAQCGIRTVAQGPHLQQSDAQLKLFCESARFNLLRHDDSAEDPNPGSFLAHARHVPSLPTRRAELSLVLAELRLVRAALEDPSTEALVLLSGSCLPLQRLHELYDIFLEGYCQGRSVLKYHFMKGGQQRVLGVPLGALQWKLWHRRELQILAALDEAELRRRWEPLEARSLVLSCRATMQRYGLAPDEVVLVNELREELLKANPTAQDPLSECCIRRAITYTEWEAQADRKTGPPRARVFEEIPEKAWCDAIQAEQTRSFPLLCRKVHLSPRALELWQERLLQGVSQDVSAPVTAAAAEDAKTRENIIKRVDFVVLDYRNRSSRGGVVLFVAAATGASMKLEAAVWWLLILDCD